MNPRNRKFVPVLARLLALTVLLASLAGPRVSQARHWPGELVASNHSLTLAPGVPSPLPGPEWQLPGPATLPLDSRKVDSWIEAALAAVPAQDDPSAAIDACVTAEMAELGAPGASIAVALDGEIVYSQGYGVKHPTEGGEIDAETQFRIASETKMMTAAAVLQLAEAGKLDMDAPLSEYLSDLTLAPPWRLSDLSLHHLLGQDSGVPDTYLVPIPQLSMPLETWVGLALPHLPLNAPPGSFWNYANPNFSLAGLVVQRLSGMTYADYMIEEVWSPAGMSRTTLDAATVLAGGNYATGFTPGSETLHPPEEFDLEPIAPAGGAFSTPSDMVRWALLLMDGGGEVLAPESVAALQGKQVYQDYLPWMYYGYGVFLNEFQDIDDPEEIVTVFDHGGNVWGYSAQLYWVPDRQMAVSVLATTMQSLQGSALCALRTVGGLRPRTFEPEPALPETWPDYEATYAMMNIVPWAFTAQAEVMDEGLRLAYTDLAGQILLEPFHADMFLLSGPPDTPALDFTFIRDREDPERIRWLRYRTLVGQRIGQFPPAVGLTGDGCTDLAFTAETELASLDIDAAGLSAPISLQAEAIAQDDPSDPSTASFKADIEIAGGANLFWAVLQGQPTDVLGLYLLHDADADGTFAFPAELVGVGLGTGGGQSLLLLPGRQPAGAYQLWVHGLQVPGDESTFDLDVDLAAGDNLDLVDTPAAVADGEDASFRVCAANTDDLASPVRGTVDFDYGWPPRRVRIPVIWEPSEVDTMPLFLPLTLAGHEMGR